MEDEISEQPKETEYQIWANRLASIDLNDPQELVDFIEAFLKEWGAFQA